MGLSQRKRLLALLMLSSSIAMAEVFSGVGTTYTCEPLWHAAHAPLILHTRD